MKFPSLLFGLLIVIFFANIAQAKTVDKKWVASLEIGSGNIVGLTFGRALSKSIDAGLGAGFDAYNQTIGEQKYSTLFLNGNIFGLYHVVDKNGIDISGRLQLGYNVLKVGKDFSTKSFDLTPAMLAGYKNIYAILSGVCMLTKEFTFVPQIGIGYRYQF